MTETFRMKLDLTEIVRTPGARATHQFCLQMPPETGLELTKPACGSLTASNTGRLLLLEGKVGATIRLACSRCLEPFGLPVSATIMEEFSTRTGAEAAKDQTIEVQEPAEAAYSEGILDLTELIRQHLETAIPIQPLCRPDCPGMCPHCGKNLSQGTCRCSEEAMPSPLEELKKIWKKGR